MEHVDVIVVGAGISGIGAAYFLQTQCPERTFTILEGRGDIGGTWDLFRYPGVRSDSDMHTLGYSFKPWVAEQSIADGPSIMAYLRETVAENGIASKIRFHHRVRRASWADGRWVVDVERADTGETLQMTAGYLYVCAGYYRYDHGYTPDFRGLADFAGQVIHPQLWPNDLDYQGKRVVVIGSGATAMTLVPALAKGGAAHVAMIQRSPTYVVAGPDIDKIANQLRRVLPDKLAYRITRKKNTAFQQFFYHRTRVAPDKTRERLLRMTRKALGDELVAQHFTPSYNPWDERLCLVPNGDLYESIRSGQASVVTGTIDTFTPAGVRMADGTVVEADIVVTATGLELLRLGGIDITVDGEAVDFAQTWTYKGFAYSGVPNLASVFGYVNASWTLRADLCAQYLCRLLNHMGETRTDTCTPVLRLADKGMPERPWIDGFNPGYIARSIHSFPKQGDRAPWTNPQNYSADKAMFLKHPVDDGAMQFTRSPRIALSPSSDGSARSGS